MKSSILNFLIFFLCSLLWGTISAQTHYCLNEYLPTFTNTETSTIPISEGRDFGLGGNNTGISIAGENGGLTLTCCGAPVISIDPNPFSPTSPTSSTHYTVPVVVHILSNENDFQVTDAMVHEFIAELNESFSHQHPYLDGIPPQFEDYAGNANISFCLAKRTPGGALTTGITRTYTPIDRFGGSGDNDLPITAIYTDLAGGKTAWDRFKYLNIWVCDTYAAKGGWSYGGHSSVAVIDEEEFNENLTVYDLVIDGVVIDSETFEPPATDDNYIINRQYERYKFGLLAHEVGHYLTLYHLWAENSSPPDCGEDDGISDTPNTEFTYDIGDCYEDDGSQSSCGTEDMYMNYMSYALCQDMFTQGQIDKMRSSFAVGGKRYSLTTSDGCGCPTNVAASVTATHEVPGDIFYALELNTSMNIVSSTWSGPPQVMFVGSATTNGEIGAEVVSINQGDYLITVNFTLENGCSFTRTFTVTFEETTSGPGGGGMRLHNGDNQTTIFDVYPNPASDYIHILTNQNVDVQLYDVTGKLIYQARQPNKIDVSNYEQGVYFIKTKIDEEEIVKKVIIK